MYMQPNCYDPLTCADIILSARILGGGGGGGGVTIVTDDVYVDTVAACFQIKPSPYEQRILY